MRLIGSALLLIVALAAGVQTAGAEPPFLLGPPAQAGPVVVEARFELRDINDIDDEAETFEFVGVMTLTWKDPRQAFDPAAAGVQEKIFTGAFQFDEISPGWYPQLILVNESGLFQSSGVLLRVQPDGTSTQVQTVNAVAETEFDLRRFPFDRHRLEAVFEVLGFGEDEVLLQVESDSASSTPPAARVAQWSTTSVDTSIRSGAARAGGQGTSSAFVVSVGVQRDSFYISRLIILPLILIVFLSFSVFWMDRSSLGDRISVSFIGILTGVAYQLVMSDNLPRISYVTLMHGFLNISFLTMCATVVVNLVVAAHDRRGDHERGNQIDRRCRWLFPLVYIGWNLVVWAVALLFF